MEKERQVLEHAAASGVPVPTVLKYMAGSPAILAMTKVGGQPLQPTDGNAIWEEVGRVLGTLHAIAVPSHVPRFDARDDHRGAFMRMWACEAAERAQSLGLISRYDVDRLLGPFADHVNGISPASVVLLHGDCQPDHFLTDGETVTGVVDFGDARAGDPTWDFAVLTMNEPDRVDALFAGYEPGRRLRRHMRRWLPAYRLLRHLGAVSWLREHGRPYDRDLAALKARLGSEQAWLT